MACLSSSTLKQRGDSEQFTVISIYSGRHFPAKVYKMAVPYVWTARSVSNVSVLPLLTWNTYNFMLNLPEYFKFASLAHLVIGVLPAKKRTKNNTIMREHIISLPFLRRFLCVMEEFSRQMTCEYFRTLLKMVPDAYAWVFSSYSH